MGTKDALMKWLRDPAADWDYNDDEGPEEVFRSLIRPAPRPLPKSFFDCGGVSARGIGDDHAGQTPEAMYRLLFLVRPKQVDFSDMYKTGLFAFTSADSRFLVQVSMFKYELGLYFGCPKDALRGRGQAVIGGHPDSDNGWTCGDPAGAEFFEMVTLAMRRKWDVYGGNDFTV